jgi:hypothetical protein
MIKITKKLNQRKLPVWIRLKFAFLLANKQCALLDLYSDAAVHAALPLTVMKP